jgi:hypothetical protein
MSLDLLKKRLQFNGGNQEGRMIEGKLKALKKALIHSYQAETAILADGREFRCLINPDKLKNDYDNKIISIPFYDICLNKEFTGEPTSRAEEPIDMKVGDVFLWKETESYWLVYLSHKEESAYFRAEIRQCSSVITIGDNEYRAYIRGPVETKIKWNIKDLAWNSLNYTKVAYIKEDEFTSNLERFGKILVDGQPFEIQAVNKDTASDGIMILYLAEDYSNTIEEELNNIKEVEIEKEDSLVHIEGKTEVYPFDTVTYTVDTIGGEWRVSNPKKVKIIKQNESEVVVEYITSRSGSVDIIYSMYGQDYILPITIQSL